MRLVLLGPVMFLWKDEDLGPIPGDDHLGLDVDAQLTKLVLDAFTWKWRIAGLKCQLFEPI